MSTEQILIIMESVIFACLLLSIIYAIGVIWRVEQELDISYKLFLMAIVFLAIAEAIFIFGGLPEGRFALYFTGSKVIFSVVFLAGMYTMRDLVRKIDGEKKKK